jgi:hypothetical protein
MTVTDTLYHVYFDGSSEVECHVCQAHRAGADALKCDADHGNGECDHVQYRVCDCIVAACSYCVVEDSPLAPVFWSVHTPGGGILLAPCLHPESNAEHPDVPLSISCDQHQRTIYYCDDRGDLWCDGGPPDYVWHDFEVSR